MLEKHHDFQFRHIGPDLQAQKEMLDFVGATSLADLMEKALPEAIQYQGGSTLPAPISEDDALARLHEIAGKNR